MTLIEDVLTSRAFGLSVLGGGCRVNCAFYHKMGACRHGDGCSRKHNKPVFSETIILQNMYQRPLPNPQTGAVPTPAVRTSAGCCCCSGRSGLPRVFGWCHVVCTRVECARVCVCVCSVFRCR